MYTYTIRAKRLFFLYAQNKNIVNLSIYNIHQVVSFIIASKKFSLEIENR